MTTTDDLERQLADAAAAERRLLERERKAEHDVDEAQRRLQREEERLREAQRRVDRRRSDLDAANRRLGRRQAERASGPATA